eukprot:TRINITY_DN9388_c2_g1_i2.p1 TRINITY_DN9388_c2_g1~~TRINITY_DN9388_c2_g1_i2.p1  ORF type:complete len:161 (+),score=23.66 TRINITY_DN9388_c2_g1_i2:25-507(+)
MRNPEIFVILVLLVTCINGQLTNGEDALTLEELLEDENITNSSFAPRVNDMLNEEHDRINGVVVAVSVGGAAVCLILATGIAQVYRNKKNKEKPPGDGDTDMETPPDILTNESPTPFNNSIVPLKEGGKGNPIDFEFPPPRENSNTNSANSQQPMIKKVP